MGRIHAPTGTNLIASREMAPMYARLVVTAITAAAKPLTLLAQSDSATPDEVVAAVAHLRAAQAEIATRIDHLVGVAILGGAAPTTTAHALRAHPASLRARLKATWAGARGKHMQRDPSRSDGWGLAAIQQPVQGGAA